MKPKKLKLNLTRCIAIGDEKRIDNNLAPMRSIRCLARELEYLWPDRYDVEYITSRLHRANKNGIRKIPEGLVQDILSILLVNEEDLIAPKDEKVL